MVGTRAKWFRAPGSPPVYEPQRPPRPRAPRVPDERKRYPKQPYNPGRPNPVPGHGDPRFPGYNPDHYPGQKPRPESAPRPRLPKPRPLRVPFGGIFPLVDMIDNVIYRPNPGATPKLPSNYYWCNGPHPLSSVSAPNRVFEMSRGPFFAWAGNCGIPPIDSQSCTHANYGSCSVRPARFQLGLARHYWWWNYTFTNTSGARGAALGTIERVGVAISPQPQAYWPVIGFGMSPDPNSQRYAAPVGDPFPPYVPQFQVGVGTPLAPEGFSNPELPFQPDFAWQFDTALDFQTPPITSPSLITPPKLDPPSPAPPRVPPVQREPPQKGEKQRKVITKTKAIGIALYKALDAASESAEVVDAVYDALPDDVKKRWKREDRPGDNFGQYGLGGADWKLQALYYNWHRVDVVQAIKNIIKNELQDRVIGGMQAVLPNNTGAAHSQGEKRLAKLLDEWFAEEFGL